MTTARRAILYTMEIPLYFLETYESMFDKLSYWWNLRTYIVDSGQDCVYTVKQCQGNVAIVAALEIARWKTRSLKEINDFAQPNKPLNLRK